MVVHLIRNVRARIAQFAAAHRWIYFVLATVFAVLVGWEVHSLSTIHNAEPVESTGPAFVAQLSDNERTVTVPHSFAPPSVSPDDPVDVAVWLDPVMGATRSRLIGPARVIDIDADATRVAVDAAAVIDIVEALSIGSVMVVGRPPEVATDD
jgi:hypothetical protein